MSGRRCLAAAAAALLPLAALARPSPRDAAALREEVAAQLARARAAMAQLTVDYSYPIDAHADRGAFVYHSLCFEPGVGLAFDSTHGETGLPPWEWTPRQKTIVVPEGWLAVWPNKRTYAFHATATPTVPVDVLEDPLFRATGLWPLRGTFPAGAAGDRSYDLEDVVADGRYTMQLEDARRLVFHREEVDRIVLDPGSGYALLERTWSNAAGTDVMRVQVAELREVAGGLWLPRTFTIERVREGDADRRGETLRGRLEKAVPVTDQPLRYEPQPGAMFLDQTTSAMTQTVAGGEDYLREQARRVRARTAAGTGGAHASLLADHVWLWGAAVFAVFLAIGRRLHARSAT